MDKIKFVTGETPPERVQRGIKRISGRWRQYLESADTLPLADGTDPARDWGRFELNNPIEARNLQAALHHYVAQKPYRFTAYKEKLENGHCYLWVKKVPRDR